MKHSTTNKIVALAIALATATASGASGDIVLTPKAYKIEASNTTFVYPHTTYGPLDGVITAKGGIGAGIEASKAFGRITMALEADYIDMKLKSVTVGGQPKNWGDSIQGYAVLAKAKYALLSNKEYSLSPTVGIGYQNVLGGSMVTSAGLELSKKKALLGMDVGLSYEIRTAGRSTYDGLEMKNGNSTWLGLTISKKF